MTRLNRIKCGCAISAMMAGKTIRLMVNCWLTSGVIHGWSSPGEVHRVHKASWSTAIPQLICLFLFAQKLSFTRYYTLSLFSERSDFRRHSKLVESFHLADKSLKTIAAWRSEFSVWITRCDSASKNQSLNSQYKFLALNEMPNNCLHCKLQLQSELLESRIAILFAF